MRELAPNDTTDEAPTKQRIIDCAGEIFADRGYRDATVRDIASSANVNLAAVSYHFGGKQQLYLAAINAARTVRSEAAPLPSFETAMSPPDRMRFFVEFLLRRLSVNSQHDWRTRLLARELMSPTEFCVDQVARWYRPIFDELLHIVEGIAGRPIDEPRRTQIGFSIIGQCLFYRVSASAVKMFIDPRWESQFDIPSLAEHICRFSLAGLVECAQRSPRAGDSR
jgi:AcrR family transcriptional regulator